MSSIESTTIGPAHNLGPCVIQGHVRPIFVPSLHQSHCSLNNLTKAALDRNQEFGIVSQEPASIATCRAYFDNLWKRGRIDVSSDQLNAWDETVTRHRAFARPSSRGARLGDFGADAGISSPSPIVIPVIVADTRQAYVKFLGEGNKRVSLAFDTIEEIKRAGCHWAVAYPASKHPSSVKDDAVIFIGRLTREPNDIRIFGRAIGIKHEPGRDDATTEDIALRPWKSACINADIIRRE